MKRVLFRHWPEGVFAMALAGFAAVAVWSGWRSRSRSIPELSTISDVPAVQRSNDARNRTDASEPTAWPPAVDQSTGRGWRFDLFTPPAIVRDAQGRLIVVSAEGGEDQASTGPLRLVAVVPAPFPAQLVGCFGREGDMVAALSVAGVREPVLVRPGQRVPGWDLELVGFDAAPPGDVAVIVRATRDGSERRLSLRDLAVGDGLVARLAATGREARGFEVREGDEWTDGESDYLVDGIQRGPDQVELWVTDWSNDSLRTEILRLPTGDKPDSPP